MKVAAVVVSHGNAADLERLLPALAPQVDELVVVANVPGSAGELPPGATLIANERPRGFGANVNLGVAATTAELVCSVNPDAIPADGAIAELRSFMERTPRAGVAGPAMVYPDGTLQPSRRRFPTVAGTLVRRTPLRLLFDPYKLQRPVRVDHRRARDAGARSALHERAERGDRAVARDRVGVDAADELGGRRRDPQVHVRAEAERALVREQRRARRKLADAPRHVRDDHELVDLRREHRQESVEVGGVAVRDDDCGDLHASSSR